MYRVRTHVVTLTLTLTFDLSTQNHVTCRISQGHSLYQVWTLWAHSFLSYAADINVNPNFDLWPFNPKPYHLQIIPRIKFEHFRMIRFGVMLRILLWKNKYTR